MARGYGQYCPLALASELLCRRWTVLIISRLLDGCSTFNEIHRGVPRISPSLLSQRLTELEHAGIIARAKQGSGSAHSYQLTEAGRDLDGVIMQLAIWGQHWARDMDLDDMDPAFLAWSVHTRLDLEAMPPGRTVVQFEFSGAPGDCVRFWLLIDKGKVDMCLKHPGFDTDLLVESDLRLFIECWRGFQDFAKQIRAGRIALTGPAKLRKALPAALLLSGLAPYERRTGKERRLSSAMAAR